MQRIAVEDRRATLLDAAVRVIARDGMARASTRAIAAEAGMPTASFHYVFDSYDAMVERLVVAVLEAQRSEVAEGVAEAADLRDFATGALLGWLDRAVAGPDHEIALHEVLTWARSAPHLPDLAATVYGAYDASVRTFVAAAEERFGVRWRVPAEDVARLVLVVLDGVAARWLVDRDEAGARAALLLGADAVLGLAEAAP